MISNSPRPQAECLHRLQHLLPRMATAAPATVDGAIDRIISTCSFLHRNMDAPPSPLDQSKVLSLAKIYSNMEHRHRHLKLTQVVEKVLFYVKQHAAVFLMSSDDTFMESLLSSLLPILNMGRNVVDTIIGIFKQMSEFNPRVRTIALHKLSLFVSTHLLPKDFLLHPSSHIVAEVLLRHIWLIDYPDYNKYNDRFKAGLVYNALTGLRAVLCIHIHHRKKRADTSAALAMARSGGSNNSGTIITPTGCAIGGELLSLVQKCTRVSVHVLEGSRGADRDVKCETGAVRLLAVCGMIDVTVYPVAYHAGVFILRRELRISQKRDIGVPVRAPTPLGGVGGYEDEGSIPMPTRARATTDAAVREEGVKGERGGGGGRGREIDTPGATTARVSIGVGGGIYSEYVEEKEDSNTEARFPQSVRTNLFSALQNESKGIHSSSNNNGHRDDNSSDGRSSDSSNNDDNMHDNGSSADKDAHAESWRPGSKSNNNGPTFKHRTANAIGNMNHNNGSGEDPQMGGLDRGRIGHARLRVIVDMLQGMYKGVQCHISHIDNNYSDCSSNDSSSNLARQQVYAVLSAMSECLVQFIISDDSVLRCVALATTIPSTTTTCATTSTGVAPIDHIVGIFHTPHSSTGDIDDGLECTALDLATHANSHVHTGGYVDSSRGLPPTHNRAQQNRSQDTTVGVSNGGPGAESHVNGMAEGQGAQTTVALTTPYTHTRIYIESYRHMHSPQRTRHYSHSEVVYTAVIEISRIIIARASTYYQELQISNDKSCTNNMAAQMFTDLTTDMYSVLRSIEPSLVSTTTTTATARPVVGPTATAATTTTATAIIDPSTSHPYITLPYVSTDPPTNGRIGDRALYRVLHMMEFTSMLMEGCRKGSSSSSSGGSEICAALSVASVYPNVVQLMSSTTHPLLLHHIVAFITRCVYVSGHNQVGSCSSSYSNSGTSSGVNATPVASYFDVTLDLLCSTFTRSFVVALDGLTCAELVKVVRTGPSSSHRGGSRGGISETLARAHAHTMTQAGHVMSSMAHGIATLIEQQKTIVDDTATILLTTTSRITTHLTAMIQCYRKLIAIQKGVLNMFVNLGGHLVKKALCCYVLYSGNSDKSGQSMLFSYLSGGSSSGSGGSINYLQLLEYLLCPLSYCFSAVVSTAVAIQNALLNQFLATEGGSALVSTDLRSAVEAFVSVDRCSLPLLRSLWVYVGLFKYLTSTHQTQLCTISVCSDSLVASSCSFRLHPLYLAVRKRGMLVNSIVLQKWAHAMEVDIGNRGTNLIIELGVCPITIIVKEVASDVKSRIGSTTTTTASIEKYSKSLYKKLQNALISLMDSNSNTNMHNPNKKSPPMSTTWAADGAFKIPLDMSIQYNATTAADTPTYAHLPPIGGMKEQTSVVVKDIGRCSVLSLDLPHQLFVRGMCVLEGLRVDAAISGSSYGNSDRSCEPCLSESLSVYIFDVETNSHYKATHAEINFRTCVSGISLQLWRRFSGATGRLLLGGSALSSDAIASRQRNEVLDNMVYLLSQLSDPSSNAVWRSYALVYVYSVLNACPWCLWHPSVCGYALTRCSYLEEMHNARIETENKRLVDISGLGDDAALVSNRALSSVAVSFISLTYHCCSAGLYYYSTLMSSSLIDYQLLDTHPHMNVGAVGSGGGKCMRATENRDSLNAPLGSQIAAEMCGSEGTPIFQSTVSATGASNGYDTLLQSTLHGNNLAVERRRAAADIASNFVSFVSADRVRASKDRKTARARYWGNSISRSSSANTSPFPLLPAIKADNDNLRSVDLTTRSYVLGALLGSANTTTTAAATTTTTTTAAATTSTTDVSTVGAWTNRKAAYEQLINSFSFCSNGLISCCRGSDHTSTIPSNSASGKQSSTGESAGCHVFGLNHVQIYLEELHRCIVLAAGFAHLSITYGLCDGYAMSSVAIMGQCVIIHFTEKTAKVLAGAFQWLLAAHSATLASPILMQLSRVLRYTAETYAGIFARRESDHSNVRKSNTSGLDVDVSDKGEEGSGGGGGKSTLIAVPTLFSTHPIAPDTKDRYTPRVGDQLGAHAVLIEFIDNIFETLLIRRDINGILFSCLEVILMDSSIYPSLNRLGSISTSNASKESAAYFPVGIAVPMYRLLGFGLKLLSFYGTTDDNGDVTATTTATTYNNTLLSLLQYCQHNNISIKTGANSSILHQKVKEITEMLKTPNLASGFRHITGNVSMSRRRILRERIYSFTLKCCNAPNNSLNSNPRQNVHQLHKLYQGTLHRCIDSEIKTLLDYLDLLQKDAATCWEKEYGSENTNVQDNTASTATATDNVSSGHSGAIIRRPGPYEVIRCVDRSLHSPQSSTLSALAINQKQPSSGGNGLGVTGGIGGNVPYTSDSGAGDGVRSVLFNPRSIFAHQRVAASGSLLSIHPPEDDAEAHLSNASVYMQRFCGISAPAQSDSGSSMLALHSNTGVLHLAKMCLMIQLDRMYAWQNVLHENIIKHKLKRDKCHLVVSDHLFATIKYNISRRTDILNYFSRSCCSKSGIHTAVLAAWSFHPSLALRLDQAFQYRTLTHENSCKVTGDIYNIRINAISNVLVADTKQLIPGNATAPTVTSRNISNTRRRNRENAMRLMTPKLANQLYELCFPRISDLIAHNPIALRADFSSAGYLLGIVGDVTFRTAHTFAAKSPHHKAGDRALSQLRMWAIYGDKNVHTIFNRLSHRRTTSPTSMPIGSGGGGMGYIGGEMYYRNTQLLEKQQRTKQSSNTHRSARCPMYLLSHWAVAPPDYAISLLQRPVLTHLGSSIDQAVSTGSGVSDDQRQLEFWQEKLNDQYFVVQYVIRSLSALDPETLLFYLPQLVQLLRRDSLGAIRAFLDEQAKTSDLLCHQLVWLLETESISEVEAEAAAEAERQKQKHAAVKNKGKNNKSSGRDSPSGDGVENGFDITGPRGGAVNTSAVGTALVERSELYMPSDLKYGYCNQLFGHDTLPHLAQRLHRKIVSSLSPRSVAYMTLECEYFNTVTNISAKLALERNKELHNQMIKAELGKMGMHDGLYLPTDPHRRLLGVDINSGTPMQSAAKCPFLLVFRTTEWGGPDTSLEAEPTSDVIDGGGGTSFGGAAEKGHTSILSNKVLPTSLQPIRIRRNSIQDMDGDNIEGSGGRNSSVTLFENGMPTPTPPATAATAAVDTEGSDEEDVCEDGSDDPSKEFANIRKSRGGGKYNQYRTLMVNNYNNNKNNSAGATALSSNNGIEQGTQRDRIKQGPSKAYSVSAIKKDFNKSISQLLQGRGLLKGTDKWYDHWKDVQKPSKEMTPVNKDNSSNNVSTTPTSTKLKQPVIDTACIFKVYDDCRQDALTIQFIRILYDAYSLEHTMPLYLYPYKVVPNRTGSNKAMGGIIQVIPDVRSRDDIGKSGAKTLLQHYRSMYGPDDSPAFKRAQRAFACSQAAYAVVCYLLQIKDRHNGNLVIDKTGHVIHIDFGFLLGISPGKNLGFESAAFKFSTEMFELLGGSMDAEPYVYFVEMTVKAFLIARELKQSLLSIIASFADSGLPCFTYRADNIEMFLGRFLPALSDAEAALEMKRLVNDACRKWTTIMYDGIQKLQNNIYSDAWM